MQSTPRHTATASSYIIGFLLSVALTVVAYVVAVAQVLQNNALIIAILVLAISQLYVQLHFFIHLGQEQKPRWSMQLFTFMVLTVLIVVIGSLWIMHNLDYNMTPHQMDSYMLEQENIKKP